MRVVLCGPYPLDEADHTAGGVVAVVLQLAHALQRLEDVEVHVISPSPRVSAVERRREPDGVQCTFIPHGDYRLDLVLGLRLIVRRLRQAIAAAQPDVVNAHGHASVILAARDCGVPSVMTIHGIYRNETAVQLAKPTLKNRVAFALQRRYERAYTAGLANVIATTDEVADFVSARAPTARVWRVENPVDDRFFDLPDAARELRILFLGQLVTRKGLHLLLEAFGRIAPAYPDCQLRIAGVFRQRSYESEIRARFADLLASGRAVLLGGVSDDSVYEEVSRSSLLCLPSLAESAPMVIGQAMAAAKPVVATRVGGIPGMVEEGGSGLLVEPGDVKGLEAALVALASDGALRVRMGQRGRELARARYLGSAVAADTISVYRELLDSGDRGLGVESGAG